MAIPEEPMLGPIFFLTYINSLELSVHHTNSKSVDKKKRVRRIVVDIKNCTRHTSDEI